MMRGLRSRGPVPRGPAKRSLGCTLDPLSPASPRDANTSTRGSCSGSGSGSASAGPLGDKRPGTRGGLLQGRPKEAGPARRGQWVPVPPGRRRCRPPWWGPGAAGGPWGQRGGGDPRQPLPAQGAHRVSARPRGGGYSYGPCWDWAWQVRSWGRAPGGGLGQQRPGQGQGVSVSGRRSPLAHHGERERGSPGSSGGGNPSSLLTKRICPPGPLLCLSGSPQLATPGSPEGDIPAVPSGGSLEPYSPR